MYSPDTMLQFEVVTLWKKNSMAQRNQKECDERTKENSLADPPIMHGGLSEASLSTCGLL